MVLIFKVLLYFSALEPWQLPISLPQAISTTTASGALLPVVWWSQLSSATKWVRTNIPLYILCHLPHTGFQLLFLTSSFFLSYQAPHLILFNSLLVLAYSESTFPFIDIAWSDVSQGFSYKSSSFMLKRFILIRKQCLLEIKKSPHILI